MNVNMHWIKTMDATDLPFAFSAYTLRALRLIYSFNARGAKVSQGTRKLTQWAQ